MAMKKTEPLEITDTGEIPIVSVDIDTSYEALLPEPVSATQHVAMNSNNMLTFPRSKYENLLPIVATVLASVVTGAVLITVGISIGAGL